MSLTTVGIVFGVIFVSELPDKSLFASLVLGTRYRALWVWIGVTCAFAVHAVIAVSAGKLLTLLSHRVVEAIVAALFLLGAFIMLRGDEDEEEAEGIAEAEEGEEVIEATRAGPTFRRVVLTSFGVVFVGEWGDITQLATANYAARYNDPLSVGVGSLLGESCVAGLAILLGTKLLDVVPVSVVRRIAGLLLLGFAGFSAYSAIRG